MPSAGIVRWSSISAKNSTPPACAACDICLGDTEPVPDSLILAQKILSCVARVEQRFGINHVVGVLRGENTEKIRSMGHDKLTTYGLLREHSQVDLRNWIYQLVGQGVLVRDGDEYPVLKLNDESWEVMKKQRPVKLLQPASARKANGPRNRGPTPNRGKGSTRISSKVCVICAGNWPLRRGCRRTSFTAIARFGNWPAFGLHRWKR